MITRRQNERGVALLLVLWIFMILGVLALDFARYMRDDAMAAVNFADETRGYYIALAGINRAIFDAEQQQEKSPGAVAQNKNKKNNAPDIDDDDEPEQLVPPDGQWHEGDFAGGRWSARMVDEGGRISLRQITSQEALLKRVISNLMQGGDPTKGVDRRQSNAIDTVVDSILDWRDPDDLKRGHGAESDFYMKRRPPYTAKNGFFDSPEELLLVRGVTAELFYGHDDVPGLRDVVSSYSRSRKLHLGTATAAVLQVILNTDKATAEDLVAQRDGTEDGNEGNTGGSTGVFEQIKTTLAAIDPILAESVDDGDSTPRVVTIEGRGDLADKRNQSHVAVVADLSSEASQGARILRWLDRAPWSGPLPGSTEGQPPQQDDES